jgi:hypothetical protein
MITSCQKQTTLKQSLRVSLRAVLKYGSPDKLFKLCCQKTAAEFSRLSVLFFITRTRVYSNWLHGLESIAEQSQTLGLCRPGWH